MILVQDFQSQDNIQLPDGREVKKQGGKKQGRAKVVKIFKIKCSEQ
jgi:hypothetical protein